MSDSPTSQPERSHRQILHATSVFGGAAGANILIGIVRVKILAVLLGPIGIGLAGLYFNIMNTVSGLAALGLGTSGVRQIAEAIGKNDVERLAAARKAIWTLSLILGAAGMLAVVLFRSTISQWVFGDTAHAVPIAWLGVAVFVGAFGVAQSALLQGYRRISDLATAGVLGNLAGGLAAVLCIVIFSHAGIVLFVALTPVVTALIGWRYVRRLPRPATAAPLAQTIQAARVLATFGAVYMTTGLLQNATGLLVRSTVTRDLGLDAAGQFQAAWSISMQYIGFVLVAMGADYYPRLSAVIHEPSHANRIVNEQAEIAVLLAAPILLATLAFAPLVIASLYSSAFVSAVAVLRWQVLGDLAKILSWPMGFILLARGEARAFFVTELAWNCCYFLSVQFGVPRLGLAATGVGFLVAYCCYFAIVFYLVHRMNGFTWTRPNLALFASVGAAGVGLHVLAAYSTGATYGAGAVVTALMAVYSVWRLDKLVNIRAWLSGRKQLERFIAAKQTL